MDKLIARLTVSAKVFEISTGSDVFAAAMNLGAEALEDGFDLDTAFDMARTVLRDASMPGRCENALTAV